MLILNNRINKQNKVILFSILLMTIIICIGVNIYLVTGNLKQINNNADNQGSIDEANYFEYTLGEFLKNINEEHTVILSVKDEATKSLSSQTIDYLTSLGSDLKSLKYHGAYILCISNGKILFEYINNDGKLDIIPDALNGLSELKQVKIESAGWFSGNSSKIMINGVNYSDNLRGFNGVILDNKYLPIKKFAADTFKEDRISVHHTISSQNIAESDSGNVEVSQKTTLNINIEPDDFHQLEVMRERGLRQGFLLESEKYYVPAVIEYDSKEYKASVRLKGDLTDHFKTEKWSLRINLNGDNAILGMKTFSVQTPEVRNFEFEWLFHQAYKMEGGISLRYKFANLVLNDIDKGIYAIEEGFEKRLIEHNKKREGPILKYNEDALWDSVGKRIPGRSDNDFFMQSQVDVFKENKTLSNDSLKDTFMHGVTLLESFRRIDINNGEVVPGDDFDISQIFNLEQFATYFALSDLFNTWHSLRWHNLRFYMNPVTLRFEPISFDASYPANTRNISYLRCVDYLCKKLFSNYEFVSKYFSKLEELSSEEYFKKFKFNTVGDYNRIHDFINTEYEGRVDKTYDDLFNQQQFIKKILTPKSPLIAYFEGYNNGLITFNIANTYMLPIEIVGVSIDGNNCSMSEESIHLKAMKPSRPLELQLKPITCNYTTDTFEYTSNINIKIISKIPGVDSFIYNEVIKYPFPRLNIAENRLLKPETDLSKYNFFNIDNENKILTIKSGDWNISDTIILPSGYRVISDKNVNIDFTDKGGMISYSPILFVGEPDNFIKISSSDATGQGIAVLSTGDEESLIKYVEFNSLRAPVLDVWRLTGAVSFYESKVNISNARFININAEDGVNIIRSDFKINSSRFESLMSDAVDLDFSNGSIMNTTFNSIVNDAIDASGSTINLSDIVVLSSGDKAISGGEDSDININKLTVEKSMVGIAAKDNSEIVVNELLISETTIGFALYQKKPEFGPASIKATNVNLGKLSMPYLIENGSKLIIDGDQIQSKQKEKEKLLIKNLIIGRTIQ